jgi:hypothetical protein
MAQEQASSRPDWLRPATWEWLPAEAKRRINDEEHIGRLMLELGVLDHPDLLRDTVVEFADGVECLIPPAAAIMLSSTSDEPLTLKRIYDGKQRLSSRAEVITAIREGNIFDQLEDRPHTAR